MNAVTWRDERLGTAAEAKLPGGTLRYYDVGSGPAVVFLHGYLVNANIWRKLVPLLAGDFRCVVPELPIGSHEIPVPPTTDLSPPGVARLVADLVDALDLDDVTLYGNDSGGAYGQLVVADHPRRIGRVVLSSCETPWCSWPPNPGGFGLLKAAARHPLTHRALYQVLRVPRTWRWYNTYGWLARQPIEDRVMRSYVRPVMTNAAVRENGRRAIGSVSPQYVRRAAERIRESFTGSKLLLWASDDRVFPLPRAERFATYLDADLRTVADSYTYTAEDQPERTAEQLTSWLYTQRLYT